MGAPPSKWDVDGGLTRRMTVPEPLSIPEVEGEDLAQPPPVPAQNQTHFIPGVPAQSPPPEQPLTLEDFQTLDRDRYNIPSRQDNVAVGPAEPECIWNENPVSEDENDNSDSDWDDTMEIELHSPRTPAHSQGGQMIRRPDHLAASLSIDIEELSIQAEQVQGLGGLNASTDFVSIAGAASEDQSLPEDQSQPMSADAGTSRNSTILLMEELYTQDMFEQMDPSGNDALTIAVGAPPTPTVQALLEGIFDLNLSHASALDPPTSTSSTSDGAEGSGQVSESERRRGRF